MQKAIFLGKKKVDYREIKKKNIKYLVEYK